MSEHLNLRAPMPVSRQIQILREENPELKDLLEVYPEEQQSKLLKNKQKLLKINKAFSGISTSHSAASMVMTCHDDCPYKDICVLKKEGIHPVGYACPIEKKIGAQLECEVIESLNIEQNNPIEMELLWDLIDTKLLDMRSSAAMKDGKLISVSESKTGTNIITSKTETSPLLEAKLNIKSLKHQIIDSFVATRRAKKKYGTNTDKNSLEDMIVKAAMRLKDE